MPYPYRNRTERLIAFGRLVLAALSLLAVWLDTNQPLHFSATTYGLLGGYFAYSALLSLIAWRRKVSSPRLQYATHAVDLAVFASLVYLTEGPTSPAIASFVFCVPVATLRWRVRGTMTTAGIALAVFLTMGFYNEHVLRGPAFELGRFMIRAVYLFVVAVLLALLGTQAQRLRAEMRRLARWPRTGSEELQGVIEECLKESCRILGAPRALVVLEEGEEPWAYVASWGKGVSSGAGRLPTSIRRSFHLTSKSTPSSGCRPVRMLGSL